MRWRLTRHRGCVCDSVRESRIFRWISLSISKIGDERQRYDVLRLKSKAIWAIFWVATEKDPEPGVIRPTGEKQRTLSLVQGLDITAIFTQRR